MAFLKLLLFASCLLVGTIAAGPDMRPMTLWIQPGSSGCNRQQIEGYSDVDAPGNTIVSSGVNRSFAIYVPQHYNIDTNLPRRLVVDCHGHHDSPKNQSDNSRYFTYPAGEPYIVAYPEGLDLSWESAPYNPGAHDLQFTTDLLTYLKSQYCIDTNHIYASGKSNGAGFVGYLACSTTGDQFAAFAMASAALYGDNSEATCNGTRPRAILESHGLRDATISYTGKPLGVSPWKNGQYPAITTWINWWAQRDSTAAVECTLDDNVVDAKYGNISYSCGAKYPRLVRHYGVHSLGHCWPTTDGLNYDYRRYKSICRDLSLDFTTEVLGFFEKYSLRSPSL